jgi:hypothetical protein
MARIPGSDPKDQPFLAKCFTRIVYALTRRRLGHVIMPVQIAARHPRILWGYGQMEQSLDSSHLVADSLKNLASLRVATLIGCPF